MKESTKSIITAALTYAITRTGYWLLNFDPIKYFSGITGFAVDIAVWLLLFYGIMRLLGRFTKKDLVKS